MQFSREFPSGATRFVQISPDCDGCANIERFESIYVGTEPFRRQPMQGVDLKQIGHFLQLCGQLMYSFVFQKNLPKIQWLKTLVTIFRV